MRLTQKIERAIRVAGYLHDGQTRKAEIPIPYITHLFSVAAILSMYTEDEDVIVAGLLHDALEDTECTAEDLERDFGIKVKETVLQVTEEKEKNGVRISWKERKENYLEQLRRGTREALLVAAADKIHNLQAIIDDLRLHGSGIWKNFAAPVEEQIWFFESVLEILKEKNVGPISEQYASVVAEARPLFKVE